jgi:hypothetical protein
LLLASVAAGCQNLGGDKENSYKWGRVGPRYLADYLRPDPVSTLGNLGDYSKEDKEVGVAVRRAGDRAQALGAISALNEDIYLVVTDAPGVGYTVAIHNGDVDVRDGLREGIKPSLVVPLTRKEALSLPELFASKSLDAQGRVVTGLTSESLFKLLKLFFIPGLRAVYSIDPLYEAGDRANLRIDDFQQVEIAPPTEDLSAARVTVLNADGQWLFLEGWHGDPDVRYRYTVQQAMDIYKAAVYDFKKIKTPTDRALASNRFVELQRDALKYTRPDHK